MAQKLRGAPKGTGKLKCAICRKPIRDHKILGPCEFTDMLATDRMTVRKPHRGNTRKP